MSPLELVAVMNVEPKMMCSGCQIDETQKMNEDLVMEKGYVPCRQAARSCIERSHRLAVESCCAMKTSQVDHLVLEIRVLA